MRRLLVLCVLAALPVIALSAAPLFGQIGLDGSFVQDIETSSATVTQAMMVNAGSNRALVVGFTTRYATSQTHDSCTFNSVAMTKAVDAEDGQFAEARASIWYLVAPDVTTANVVCTASASTVWAAVGIVSLQGVHQASPLGDIDTDTPAMGVASIAFDALTTSAANSFVFDAFQSFDGGNWSMDAEANRTQHLLDTSQGDTVAFSSINPKVSPGAVTMQWSHTSSADALLVGAEFLAAAAAAPKCQQRSLLGVGC